MGGVNWEKYNRIQVYVYPECEGARSIYLNLYVENISTVLNNNGRFQLVDHQTSIAEF
ncbi:MAG: hypothetical protein ACK5HT_09735 [Draconibacterium sp.]